MKSFKEIIAESEMIGEMDGKEWINKHIGLNKDLINTFFRLCVSYIKKVEAIPDDEDTKIFVDELMNINSSSNLEQVIFRIKIPYWFRIRMTNTYDKELTMYLLKQLIYMKENNQINKRLLSQIVSIATQPIVTTTSDYYFLVLHLFVECIKHGLNFPEDILAILKDYFRYSIEEIYESDEKMLFLCLNKQFNDDNEILKKYTKNKEGLYFNEYAFILKHALCLKKYDILSNEIKQILIDILINQHTTRENVLFFETTGKKKVTHLGIDNYAEILSVLNQLEEDYSISSTLNEDELFSQLDLFKAFLYKILFDDEKVLLHTPESTDEDFSKKIKQFEHRMREFLRDHLINEYKDKWFEEGIPDEIQKEIEEKIKRDKSKEIYKEIGNPLHKCTINNYKTIIIYNWGEVFKKNFESKSTLKVEFENLNTLRNAIDHHEPEISEHTQLKGEAAIKWFKSTLGF